MLSERPRSPGVAYAALSVAMVLLLALLALAARQPPPPTIAEFAPQAIQNITESPDDQSSRFGRAGGLGPGGSETPAPAGDVLKTIDVARVRKCIGDPPRQIEDPQSPPCVPYWSGDNGGATARGVTRDSIRIGLGGAAPVPAMLVNFFNSRFEFYGRKLVWTGAGGGNNCDQKRASAVAAAEIGKLFAAGDPANGGVTCFYDELAKRGVVAVTVDPHLNEQYLRSQHPYIWSYPMPTEDMYRNIGRWACRRLGHQKARFSTDPLLKMADRKFGIILQTTTQVTGFDVAPIRRELAACGQSDVPFATYNHDHGGDSTKPQGQGVSDPTLAANAVLKMKTEGVTSVICLCVIFVEQYLPSSASSQNYYPEWLMSTWFFNDASVYIKTFWPGAEQRRALMGVTFRPREVPYADTPVVWAMREMDASFQFATSLNMADAYYPYRSLLMIASGIQMAGPKLTPQTFAQALQRTKFPNPDHPIKAGAVGFATDHGMTEDAAEFSWIENDASYYPDEGPGMLCFTNGGQRHRLDDWPAGDDGLMPLTCPTR